LQLQCLQPRLKDAAEETKDSKAKQSF